MTHRLLAAAVGCAAALCLASAGPALADSIVYVKNGNVWLTSPDGARTYQVTFDGGYDSPSQADDGTIVAIRNRQIVRMDRSGRRIGSPVNAVGTDPGAGGSEFYGPYEARVSPDGRKVAYWFGQYEERYDSSCSCTQWTTESYATWTWADRFTDPNTQSEYLKGASQPEWIAPDRLLVGQDFWMNAWTWELGTGTGYTWPAAQWWFGLQADVPDQWGVRPYLFFGDMALSPDGTKLAMTDGGDETTNDRLTLAAVTGPAWVGEPPYDNDYTGMNNPVTPPTPTCQGTVGTVWNPDFSPDSQHLTYSTPDGVHVLGVTADAQCGADRLLAPGGQEPVWGPADVDMAQKPSPPPPSHGTGPGSAPPPSGTPAAALRLSAVAVHPRTFRAARSGRALAGAATGTHLTFRLSAPARLTLKVKGAHGTIKTAGRPGRNRVRFMGRIGHRTLRPHRYTLSIAAAPLAGGKGARATVHFRIKR